MVEKLFGFLGGLVAADRLLHLGGQVLHPHRDPVETQPPQGIELPGVKALES